MTDKDLRVFVWRQALAYLAERADMELVRKHMSLSDRSRPGDMRAVYRRFLETLSNKRGMPNSIGDIDRLSGVLRGFDHGAALERYPGGWGELFDTVAREIKPTSRMKKDSPQNYWVVFCKGCLSGARWLGQFGGLDEFLSFVRRYDTDPLSRPVLPVLIENDVFGYGFALACDFLKELGFSNYCKPDVHLTDIFKGVGLSDGTQLGVFRQVSLMAEEVGETPYAVDKAFWLIGSGRLYLDGVKFGTDKKEFVARVRSAQDQSHA